MIHSGIQGQLDEVSRSMWVCPWGHLCIFLGNTKFWKVAWFFLPLKGLELGILRFGGRFSSLLLISCVMCDLGQVRLSELQFFLHVREDNRHMATSTSQDG